MASQVSESRCRGRVKLFRNGYGFIIDNRTQEEVFVHQTGIQVLDPNVFRVLYSGEDVEFDRIQGKDGKPQAVHVTGIDQLPLRCQTQRRPAAPRPMYQEVPRSSFGLRGGRGGHGFGRGGFRGPRGSAPSGEPMTPAS